MKGFIVFLIIFAALAFGALNYHVIWTDNGVKLLKKTELTLDSTFVDARGAKKLKLFTNPALIKAGIKEVFKNEGVVINPAGE